MTSKAHTHEYKKDTRPEWGGFICTICGFRIPPNLEASARNAGAIFS